MGNVKQKFLQSHFLKSDHQGLLKGKVRLIDKTQASDPNKREFYWMRTLKTLYPDVFNFFFKFGSPSNRVLSLVPAIAFSSVLFIWPH